MAGLLSLLSASVCIFLRPDPSQWRVGSCCCLAELTSRAAAYMYSLELDRDSAEHSVPAAVSPPPDTQNLLSNRTQGCHQLTMSKKIVIKADLVGQKCKSEILAAVSKLQAIKSLDIDAEKCTLTVVGTVDPVCVALRLKKKCFAASIVSVEDDKPKDKDKDPCKEACEKLCKAKCEKITCCKECKEKCEKECKDKCEKACEAWLGKGCCSCGGCKPRSPGFYCNPVPSYPSHYGCPSSYPYYACYEERSPDGACTIQ